MPRCFKCGKELATDQSLQYHLNKRVKCNSLYCDICHKQFPNKLLYETHFHVCQKSKRELSTIERYKVYDFIKSNNIFLIELDREKHIQYISKHFIDKLSESFMDQKLSDLLSESTQENLDNALKTKSNECSLNLKEIACDTIVTHLDGGYLLTNTIVT